jgi:hypothetical protein
MGETEADREYDAARDAELDALRRLREAESDLIEARRRKYAVRDQTTYGKLMRDAERNAARVTP